MPYGNDAINGRVRDAIRTAFEAPEAAVYLVAPALLPTPFGSSPAIAAAVHDKIFCSVTSHIHEDECTRPNSMPALQNDRWLKNRR